MRLLMVKAGQYEVQTDEGVHTLTIKSYKYLVRPSVFYTRWVTYGADEVFIKGGIGRRSTASLVKALRSLNYAWSNMPGPLKVLAKI